MEIPSGMRLPNSHAGQEFMTKPQMAGYRFPLLFAREMTGWLAGFK